MTNVYIIAEAGVNHNGDFDLARQLIDVAAHAGADAVKFQTFDANKLATTSAPKADYQLRSTSCSETQLEMLQKLQLPLEWYGRLVDHARSRGIQFLSTAFDADSLSFLVKINLPFYKVPSGELTNAPLLWKYARLRKPLVISTGMATLAEVEQALAIVCHALHEDDEPTDISAVWSSWSNPQARASLKDYVTLLHCTSEYPTPMHQVNLAAMDTLKLFGVPVGYSDHTEGILIPVAAAARGATIIEKHFTLDRAMSGPDHKASLEPAELAQMVSHIRDLQMAIGDGIKCPQLTEWDVRSVARQFVIAARDIQPNSFLRREDLATARTGGGLPASALWGLIGKTTSRAYAAGEAIAP